jgi:magnesium chelatase subunit D
MRSGALLYLEEFNRVPEETLNVLITVLAEGEIAVPRLGMVLLVTGLARMRGEDGMARATARDAAHAALSGRIRIADGCDRSPESVLDELLGGLWPEGAPAPPPPDGRVPGGGDGDPDGRGKASGLPSPAAGTGQRRASASAVRRDRAGNTARRTIGRAELAARHESFGALSPGVGQLDEDLLAELLAADPDTAVTLLADLARATDRELRAAAQRVAGRVFFRLGAAGPKPSRGVRRLAAGRAEGDLDLDKTLDRWPGSWPPDAGDLVTRSWQARRRALCLLIDHSGSMSGLAVAIAAVAAASVVLAADGRLAPAIVAFSGGVTVLQAQGTRRDPADLAGDLVALRGHGMTDLAAALRAAAAQLAGVGASERVAVLLSDCLPTTGGDPALALTGISRLHVLCPRPAAEAERAAADLARRGGGVSQPVRRLTDVAPALTRVLSA